MSATTAPASGSAADAVPREPRSRFRRLVHLYTSPGDLTPTWVGVAIGLLAVAGLVVLGPTDRVWLLACTGLLVYAVVGVTRPVQAWRILRSPAGAEPPDGAEPPAGAESPVGTEPPARDEPPAGDEDASLDTTGWLPTRRAGRR